ncbi:hypothetical protein JNUCC31_01805 [Paenibacillus sp. JNUCC31]|uniref:hypothetical protein n=1 Tax=Paenibacillus sp. JNUCC-31 TaxID=2777983 RepID=UPI00177E12CA|nr:hypothetical protein [Paenibacillus sp. JNUCC-31]QOS79716.1 hypothetical protein JNUCC31_01805 [Paenibacillus sp. JNUCC-31]
MIDLSKAIQMASAYKRQTAISQESWDMAVCFLESTSIHVFITTSGRVNHSRVMH